MKYSPVGFRAGGSLKVYAEMMKSLDDGIGRVLGALRATGRERNTLVIFTSDNGGERFSYNWPFSGQKFDLHEGGIRVPAIVRWPGIVPVGTTSDQPVITMDWTATILSVSGAKTDPKYPLDGDDLSSVISAKRTVYDRTFFWRTRRQGAMRSGKWKYLREGKADSLFDLSVDEHEQADFKDTQPQILSRLRSEFQNWEASVLAYPART
jgi:arylsulfatase A-like enzyme